MKHRNRFQNQELPGVQPKLTPTTADHHQKSQEESATERSQSVFEKSIQTSVTVNPAHNQTAAIAYQLYLQDGRPFGRDLQHWLEAEAQLAAIPPVTVKTELTVKAELTVKNEVGVTPKANQPSTHLAVRPQLIAN